MLRGMYIYMNSTEINTSNRSTTVNTPNSSSVFTTSNRSTTVTPPNRKVVVDTLAVVGFIALIGASMWLAVYSTRFVPGVVNRIGGAAVYLGSVFTPAPEPSLSVVSTPVASTTISFGEASSTISTTASSTTSTVTKPVSTTAGSQTNITQQISGTGVAPSGLPDLAVTISAIGYLATASADSFIESSTVPSGSRPAVKFTIKNIGTNWTGTWRFSASIPTWTAYVYQSAPQQTLSPGDSIDYTLGFDQANSGTNQMITITANFDHTTADSNPNNNSISAAINIL